MNWRTLRYDYLLLRGDPMLILSFMVPFILWALMQFIFPLVSGLVLNRWSVDISAYYTMTGSFFLLLIPMMIGMVYGFILLDERDEGVITAISVTPTGKSGYLKLRLGIPLLLSLGFILLFQVLLGLSGMLSLIQRVLISILIASQALLLLLFLGGFADNKVMGLAISKGFGLLLLGPLLDFVLPGSLKWIGAYSPLFWATRSFLSIESGLFWLYFVFSLVIHGLLIWLLLKKFLMRSD